LDQYLPVGRGNGDVEAIDAVLIEDARVIGRRVAAVRVVRRARRGGRNDQEGDERRGPEDTGTHTTRNPFEHAPTHDRVYRRSINRNARRSSTKRLMLDSLAATSAVNASVE